MKVVRVVGVALVGAVLAGCTGPLSGGSTAGAVSVPGTTRTSHDVGWATRSPSPTTRTPKWRSDSAPRPGRTVAGPGMLSGRRLYVFIDPPDGGPRAVQLRVSTLRADRFVTIGPHVPRDFYPDTLFVLDWRHLWFTTYWDGGGRERLYRTSNAGATWHWTPIVSHSMAGGSTDALWFTDPDHGWLTDIQPTAPDAALYATADGGRHWHVAADIHRRDVSRSLPTLGRVEYQPDNTTAWDAAPAYYSVTALYVTRSGGDSWQIALSVRHRAFTAPGVFGTTVLEPVSWCTRHITRTRLFVSADDGVHWTRTPVFAMGAIPASDYGGPDCQPVAAAVPNAHVVWVVATAHGNRLVVKNTCDQGQQWHTARPPRLRVEDGPEITAATDCRHALLDVHDLRGTERLYLTNDGGSTWQAINRRATG